ncbi:MAG TPA: ribonuclease III domain-containing protein [Pseudogracilibacillus sp.]|nr:ribonuclease III domain-containing protein [Pseudogracilibacillus sp.]
MVKAQELSSLALAYVGDAVFELFVRNYLIEQGGVKPHELHKQAVDFVSAPAQAAIVQGWLADGRLTKEEAAIVRRGRNAKSHSVPKNISVADYKFATAFEALIGFHYLSGNEERLKELLQLTVERE